MAGEGSRFKKQDINKSKHEILFKEKTLFKWSMQSLKSFFEEEFIFIVRKDSYDKNALVKEIQELGILNYQISEVDQITSGQSETVILGIERLSLKNDFDFLIYNIDTHIKKMEIEDFVKDKDSYDGAIFTTIAEGDHWSFVNFDDDNFIYEIKEKIRISEYVTIGLYWFKSFDLFRSVYKSKKEEIIKNYNETYVAPIYEVMINDGYKIKNISLPKESLVPMGKPEELDEIETGYDWRIENE